MQFLTTSKRGRLLTIRSAEQPIKKEFMVTICETKRVRSAWNALRSSFLWQFLPEKTKTEIWINECRMSGFCKNVICTEFTKNDFALLGNRTVFAHSCWAVCAVHEGTIWFSCVCVRAHARLSSTTTFLGMTQRQTICVIQQDTSWNARERESTRAPHHCRKNPMQTSQ